MPASDYPDISAGEMTYRFELPGDTLSSPLRHGLCRVERADLLHLRPDGANGLPAITNPTRTASEIIWLVDKEKGEVAVALNESKLCVIIRQTLRPRA